MADSDGHDVGPAGKLPRGRSDHLQFCHLSLPRSCKGASSQHARAHAVSFSFSPSISRCLLILQKILLEVSIAKRQTEVPKEACGFAP